MNSVPEFLNEKLNRQYGEEIAAQIVAGYAQARPVTLRVNTLKTDVPAVCKAFSDCGISFCGVPWFSGALVLNGVREEEIRKTALYERGEIYLQSLSSMLPPLFLGVKAGESVLDMTAAPGGKTTEISALTGGQAFITACEKDKIRAERLKYNLAKQGAPRVSVLCEDATKLDEFFSFDRILLDAPCSGSGTLDLRAPLKISSKLVENCAALQKKLLAKALRLLKKGGTLVYSTCSVLREENEEVLQSILPCSGCVSEPIAPFEGLPLLPSAEGTLCVAPSALYEGFFVARIKKVSSDGLR